MPNITRPRCSFDTHSSTSSNYSDGSHYSASTAPTVHSVQRPIQQGEAPGGNDFWHKSKISHEDCSNPTSSTETYASTISSSEEIYNELGPFDASNGRFEIAPPTALASSPREFAEYFPSTHKLSIKHDDSTIDGNMNLRIDTEAQMLDGPNVDLTLFHLRMHDLKRRRFSLRRYCRDSGREICTSSRKYTKPSVVRKPDLPQSMSNALSSLRSRSDTKTATLKGLRRHDSGYGSLPEEESKEMTVQQRSNLPSSKEPTATNTTQLEFSNYTHLEIKRRGSKIAKKYEFDYWGTKYAWKRIAVKSGNYSEVSYHLVNTKTSASYAHIVPVPLTNGELQQEEAKGGWVPPCSMWISDEKTFDKQSDVAE